MTISKKRLAVAAVIASVALGTAPQAQAQVKMGQSRPSAAARSAPVLVNFHPQVSASGTPAAGQIGGVSGATGPGAAGLGGVTGAGAAGGPGGTGAGTPGAAVAGSAGALPGAASGQPGTGATSSVGGLQLTSPGITGGGGPSGAAAGQAGGGLGTAGALGGAQVGELPPASSGRLAPIMMQGVREPIGAADISVEQIGTQVIPEDQAAKQIAGVMALPGGEDRGFACITYRWQAANIEHWPLYFEDPMLERHGQQRCGPVIQPAVSGAKFFGDIVLYPYKATLWPALESRYTLGHFRPGSPAPLLRDTLPWSRRAALVQGAAVTGVFVGLPW